MAKKSANPNKSKFIKSATSKSFQKGLRPSEDIFGYIKKHEEKIDAHKLFERLGNKYNETIILNALETLEKEDKISISSKGQIKVKPKKESTRKSIPDKGLIRGKVDMTRSGDLYIIPADGTEKDIFVIGRNAGGALDGDIVDAMVKPSRGRRLEGVVVRIIKRAQDSLEGSIYKTAKGLFFRPREEKIKRLFTLDNNANFQPNEQVIARILNWEKSTDNSPEAEVIERIADLKASDLEMKRILIQNGFHTDFQSEVYADLEKIPDQIPEKEIVNRKDYRSVLTFTIDPEDAKDFDDALSIQRLANNDIEIGIHIADVSHYLIEGSPLDKEAEQRATSVYLPDRVCPMLPERLSNFLCSLRPNEDKLTFSSIFTFDPDTYTIKDVSFGKTVIHSDKRFTYEEVQTILESKEGLHAEELLLLDKIAKKIRKKRTESGAISFEKDEVRFKLDDTGKPIGIYVKQRKDAHLLVEDFMLIANEYVAKFGAKLKDSKRPSPFVYRVHDKPDQSKLEQFSHIAKRFGYNVKFKDAASVASALNSMLLKIQGKPEQSLLETLAIRSMAKAEYSTRNIGHYGLGMPFYTHFTSPIRRYPDVMVHRLLFKALTNDKEIIQKEPIEISCKNSSLMERKANDAEREATKYKQVEYMQDKVGQQFEGIISGVIGRGIFVEMNDTKCEGMVTTEDLGNENFMFDEVNISLTGMKTQTMYKMGDKIKVLVKRTSLAERKIDLVVVS
jgi:ribonuclease R